MGCGREHVSGKSSNKDGCVCDVVRAIFDIQELAVTEECRPCMTNCFLEPLGGIVSPTNRNADTRVFMLITKTGAPFMSFFKNVECQQAPGTQRGASNQASGGSTPPQRMSCTSVFYRVEDVFDDCCATLRVLKPLKYENGPTVDLLTQDGNAIDMSKLCKVNAWEATDSCITVDLRCFCAVECIADTFLDLCD